MNLLAVANTKQKAIDAVAPNAVLEPGSLMPILSVLFFIASAGMIWLIIRAGKGKDYGD